MKAVITSQKHYFHVPAAVVTSGATSRTNIVKVDDARATANAIQQGAVVKAVYVEMWVSGVTADKTVLGTVYKIPGGANPMNYADTLNLGSYDNKKNILSTHQGLAPTGGNIVPLFREWVLIPKGKQRFGLGDLLAIDISATGTNVNLCGFFTFKEYY